MKRAILLSLALATSACSTVLVPTSPTGVLTRVDWQTPAPACSPRMPGPALDRYYMLKATRVADTLDVEYRATSDLAPHTLITATFHANAGQWQICNWDTSD